MMLRPTVKARETELYPNPNFVEIRA
jgi:hypothetical protein